MALDPNIILQSGNFKTPDYATTLAQVANLKAAGQEAKLRDLQISGVQRDDQTRKLLSKAFDPTTGEVDPVKAKAAFMASGDVAGARKFETDRLAAVNAQIDNAMKIHGTVSQILGGVTDQASLDAARAELGKNPALAQGVAQLPAQYDEAGAAAIQNLLVQGQTVGEQLQAKKNAADAARQKAKDDQDKLQASPDFKASVAKAESDAKLPNELKIAQVKADNAVALKQTAPASVSPPFTDAQATLYAEQGLAGDKSVFTNVGRNQAGRTQIAQKMADLAAARNIKGADLAAINAAFAGDVRAQQVIGQRTGAIAISGEEAKGVANLVKDAYAKLPRGEFKPFNELQAIYANQTNSPEQGAAAAADFSLATAYARALNPQGIPRETDIAAVGKMMNTNGDSYEKHAAVVDQILKEIEVISQSTGAARISQLNKIRIQHGLPVEPGAGIVAPGRAGPAAPVVAPAAQHPLVQKWLNQ